MPAALTHVETTVLPGQRLGLRPVDESRETLPLGQYLTGKWPTQRPAVIDHYQRITVGDGWLLGRNNEFGTCGPTSLANLLLLVSTWLGDTPFSVSDADIIDLYKRSGNPDFDPATGAGDNGVDMTVMLSATVQGGIGGHYPLGFAEVDSSDPEEVWAAGAIFGGMLWGMDLTQAQQAQTATGLWDTVPNDAPWGGHAVMAAGQYTTSADTATDRTKMVTWKRPVDVTDGFLAAQVPRRYVVIWPEHLGSRSFIEGVNLAALAADYQGLTGRTFPVPVPSTVPAKDRAFAEAIHGWAYERHLTPATRHAAQVVRAWLVASNL